MKTQQVIVEIDSEGRLSVDASGFEGDACLRDLERLMRRLGTCPTEVRRKGAADDTSVKTVRRLQTRGKK